MRYTKPGDWIVDQFLGSGTTLIEAKLLNRNAIGLDINFAAIQLSKKNLQFSCKSSARIFTRQGDARDMAMLKTNSVDFICTHPPYANIIKYSNNLTGDISCLPIDEFLEAMTLVAKESYRVLKSQHYCAIMIGDIRSKGNVFPLGFNVMQKFLKQNFSLHEIVIKEQHNCRSNAYWFTRKTPFLLLAHEYIFVFMKE